MNRSFGLDAPSLLEEFKGVVDNFKKDDLNGELARDCALKAWHLCDHVFTALANGSQFTTLRKLQDHVKQACPELAYLQDICIETKHAKITKYAPRIDETRSHGGAFSKDFSRDFDISRLEIELTGGQTVWFIDVVDCAVTFWSQFFVAHGIK